MPHNPPLDRDLVERARSLWNEGKTASEIGRIIGKSKHSVVSMAHRNGFAARQSPIRRITRHQVNRVVATAKANPTISVRALAKAVAMSAQSVNTVLQENEPMWSAALRARILRQQNRAARAAIMASAAPSVPDQDSPDPVPARVAAVAEKATHNPEAHSERLSPLPPSPEVLPDQDDDDETDTPARRAAPTAPAGTCQWPIGEPGTAEFRFCGSPKQFGSRIPYCQHHRHVATARPNQPKEDAA